MRDAVAPRHSRICDPFIGKEKKNYLFFFFFKAILERDAPSVTHLTLSDSTQWYNRTSRSRSPEEEFPKFSRGRVALLGRCFFFIFLLTPEMLHAMRCVAHASDFLFIATIAKVRDTARLMLDCCLRGYNQTSDLLVRYERILLTSRDFHLQMKMHTERRE